MTKMAINWSGLIDEMFGRFGGRRAKYWYFQYQQLREQFVLVDSFYGADAHRANCDTPVFQRFAELDRDYRALEKEYVALMVENAGLKRKNAGVKE
jgi:hypothetical protein